MIETTQLYSKEEIMAKTKELASMLAQSQEVQFFQQAEKKIQESQHVQQLIAQVKRKQKEATHLEHAFNREDMAKQKDEEIGALMAQLDEIPLVQEFKQSQQELNDLLQIVTNMITIQLTEKVFKENGGGPVPCVNCDGE